MANSICVLFSFFLWPYQSGMNFGRAVIASAAPCCLQFLLFLRQKKAGPKLPVANTYILKIEKKKYFLGSTINKYVRNPFIASGDLISKLCVQAAVCGNA